MKFVIMGTGGIGGYYGALLSRSGQDVTFIARGAHLQAIREKGLIIKSVHGDFIVFPAQATDIPADAGIADVILFATKTYQTDEAAFLIKPLVGPDTAVISFQNGIDSADRIGAVVGMEHMLGGATWCSVALEAPGVIGQYSQFRRIALGEFTGEKTQRLQAVHDAFNTAGFTMETAENILKVLWTKFAFIAPVMLMGSLTRMTFGDYRHVPEARAVLTEAINEVAALAKAGGVALDADVADKTLAFIDSGEPGIKPSMQRDVESGRPSELESMIGVAVRLGIKYNVPTPVMRFAYAMLKPRELHCAMLRNK
ncbi:MAG: 2-dehydropantoate 2-reductase [Deltaproteobacteria bacterium HGW-Deltaproteobacteria-10]|nr:MAG: 2-dehydropantoate 2-reductase [Deltaproteobacteria bacterium HGW-Deltaproteobacteria-10]